MNKLTLVPANKLTEAKAALGSLNVAFVHVRRKSRDDHMKDVIRKATKADLATVRPRF